MGRALMIQSEMISMELWVYERFMMTVLLRQTPFVPTNWVQKCGTGEHWKMMTHTYPMVYNVLIQMMACTV